MKGIFCIIFLWVSQTLYAQNYERDLQDARQFYADGDFVSVHDVVSPLIDIYPADVELQFLMGWSSYFIPNQYRDARFYLAKAAYKKYELAYFWYGKMLFENNKLDSAEWFFNQTKDSSQLVLKDRYLAYLQNARAFMLEPETVIVQPLSDSVNSQFVEHSPIISWDDSTLYFTSRRPINEKAETDFQSRFDENIYRAKRTKNGWSQAKPLSGNVNDLLNEATVALLPNEDKMLVFQTARDFESSDLFWVEHKENQWRVSEKLSKPINSESIEVGATVNSNGNVFIIASNRPGGFGGFDLYRVVKFANGKLSEPVNLGADVNSAYDEQSPFLLQDDNTLYFSSNRPESMGGFDVFSTKRLAAGKWSQPKNLGYPLNTTSDDNHITISWKTGRAYLTRRSDRDPNDYDIVSANLPGFNVSATVVKFQIKTDQTIDFSDVKLSFKKESKTALDNELQLLKANDSGQFIVALLPQEKGVLKVELNGFETLKVPLQFDKHEGLEEQNLTIDLIQKAK